jgi:hypothetical protein
MVRIHQGAFPMGPRRATKPLAGKGFVPHTGGRQCRVCQALRASWSPGATAAGSANHGSTFLGSGL